MANGGYVLKRSFEWNAPPASQDPPRARLLLSLLFVVDGRRVNDGSTYSEYPACETWVNAAGAFLHVSRC